MSAASRKGAGCQALNRNPPATSAIPSADPAQHVLHALRAAVQALVQDVRVEPAVGRLVHVVGEEEGQDDQRHRPDVRHEGDDRQAEADRPNAANMNGRRRPIGVWNVSLHGPITSGNVSANTPSAASTAAISVLESVNFSSSGGRYAAVVVIEKARPNAPRPEDPDESSPRAQPDRHPIADDVDDRPLRTRRRRRRRPGAVRAPSR